MIKNFKISHLRNSEFVQFHQDILDTLKKQPIAELKLETVVQPYEQQQVKIAEAFKLSRKSDITKELQGLDQNRDDVFTGLSYFILANTYHYNEEYRTAANKLKEFIDWHGKNVARMNYSSETSTISSILGKCESNSELKLCIEKLELSEWLKELENINNNFHNVYLSRVEEKAASSDVRISELRKLVQNSYQKVQDFINAFALIDGEEKYEPVMSRINIIVDEYNQRILNRKSSNTESEVVESTDVQ